MQSEIDQLKNMLIVWGVSMEFIDLSTLLNGEQSFPEFLNKKIKQDSALVQERDNQITIQREKLERDVESDKQARLEKISIIENQRNGISARVKFYQETLEDLKK